MKNSVSIHVQTPDGKVLNWEEKQFIITEMKRYKPVVYSPRLINTGIVVSDDFIKAWATPKDLDDMWNNPFDYIM